MSPVIIITEIPASLHFSIDLFTSGLGGSYNATTPIIIGLFSNSEYLFVSTNKLCASCFGPLYVLN